ncbi:MAG: sensor histidine kinase [Bacteroidota bacterium]|nr:sensor histidine kinase [Bacteroidota bacterium]
MLQFKNFVLSVIFILSVVGAFAQDKQLDSLLVALKKSNPDTSKVNLLNKVVAKYQYADPPKAMDYSLQMIELSKKLHFNYGLAMSYSLAGGLSIEKSDFEEGTKFYTEALELVAKEKDIRNRRLYGRIKQSFGVIAYYQEDYSTAVEYYLEAAKIYKEINDEGLLLIIYNNLSSVHAIMIDKKKALHYAEECYSLSKKIRDPFKISMACVALASAKIELKDYLGVKEYLVESQKIADSLSNYVLLGRTYSLFGQLMAGKNNDNKKSIDYFEKAITNFEKSGSQFEIAAAHQRLGEAYSISGNYQKAKIKISKSIAMAKELGVLQIEMHSLKSLSELEEKNNNQAEALKLLKNYNVINDSLNIEGKQKQVSGLEAKYETKIKELKILQLQKEKELQKLSISRKSTINYILFGSIAGLLILGFVGFRNFSQRQKLARQQDQLQQQQIRELEKDKQLVAVDSMLKGQEEERSRLAKDLHDGLGGLLSGVKFSISNMKDNLVMTPDNMIVFERSLDMIDTSIKELRRVAHNMMPEMLTRFGLDEAVKEYCNIINTTKLLTVKYQSLGMEARLDKSVEIIIYRIIQELLNNTMKHAAATESFVQLIREGNRLNVVVEDNGKGFNMNLPENKDGAGIANVRSRVDYLKGQLDIHSELGKGTLVNIEFKV